MLTKVIIVTWQVNQMVLTEKYHTRSTHETLTWNYTYTSLQPPSMRDLINREKLVKIFLTYFPSIRTQHTAKELSD